MALPAAWESSAGTCAKTQMVFVLTLVCVCLARLCICLRLVASGASARVAGVQPLCKLTLAGTSLLNRKLFHLLIGNCFTSCHLLIEITVERAPKFVSIGYFCGHLVTSVLLIELYPMVPFVPLVLITQSVYIGTASAWTPATRAEAIHACLSCCQP